MKRMQLPCALGLMLALSACASTTAPVPAVTAASTEPVSRVAELLAQAGDPGLPPEARAKLLGQLDQLDPRLAEDSADDPVADWRREALALGLAPPPMRGRALGPAYRSGWLEPGTSLTMDQLFLAGTTANIMLTSPNRAPLSLHIIDRDRNTVCRKDGPLPGRCQWMAIFTQRYRIELRNPGNGRRRYFLVSN